MKKIAPALILATLFSGSAAFADNNNSVDQKLKRDGIYTGDQYTAYVEKAGIFRDHDLNNDGKIDEREFDGLNMDVDFKDWDANNDSYLTSTEFGDGAFKAFDDNEDGHWDEGEWDDAGDAGLFDI